MLSSWRKAAACLLWTVLIFWPAWSLVDYYLYLQRYQPTSAQASATWAARGERFTSLSTYLPPGQVVAYHTNWPLPANGSMLHEAQLAGAPVIITDLWYPDTDLVLVDVADDSAMERAIKAHDYALLKHFGVGFALCRRQRDVPGRPKQDKDAVPAVSTP